MATCRSSARSFISSSTWTRWSEGTSTPASRSSRRWRRARRPLRCRLRFTDVDALDRTGGAALMAKVVFTTNVQRHVECPQAQASGATVREVLDSVFAGNPQARGYVLDDQAALR